MAKRLFRAVSANPNDRCVSYSTYEKAYAKLKEWCDKYGYDLDEEPYNIYVHDEHNPGYVHKAKCLYDFRGWSNWGNAYAFTIVEMKTEEEYKQDLLRYYGE